MIAVPSGVNAANWPPPRNATEDDGVDGVVEVVVLCAPPCPQPVRAAARVRTATVRVRIAASYAVRGAGGPRVPNCAQPSDEGF
nr:hypothetical protein GCM10017745_68460 [Saccharothrix mutabilis subsp. capreolus]